MNFKTLIINDRMINKYLCYKNLEINRNVSSSKKKINKLDHYLWWLADKQNRKSFLILKKNKPVFISTIDNYKYKQLKFVYSGMLSCLSKTNLFDLLKAIKIQNVYLDKKKGSYCFIAIDKKNRVLLYHWKYFGYNRLFKNEILYKLIKKSVNISSKFNIYYKKI
jgi:hypothetical protein